MAKTQGVQKDSSGATSIETLKVVDTGNHSRIKNDNLRGRKHLTGTEITGICDSIKATSRYALRDELMVLMCYHHGYRASELVDIQWQHVDLKIRQLQVNRVKNGINNIHPITDKREILLLTRLHKAQNKPKTGYLFNTERNTVMSVNSLQKMFSAMSEKALGIKWNVHALRHACGTDLVSQGIHLSTIQHFMGHKNIQNTAIYLHNSTDRFKEISWN